MLASAPAKPRAPARGMVVACAPTGGIMALRAAMLPRPKCCAARGVSTASPGVSMAGTVSGEPKPGTADVPRANPVLKYPMLGAFQPPGIMGDGWPLPPDCAPPPPLDLGGGGVLGVNVSPPMI